MSRRVAIVGFGAIGKELAAALRARGGYDLAVVLRPGSKALGELSHQAPHAEVLACGEPRSTQDGASFEAPLRGAPQDEDVGRSRTGAGTSRDMTLVTDPAGLAAFGPALVVEAAGAGAVREWGPTALALGVPLLLSSVGALHDEALRTMLVSAAEQAGTRLYLPSGALAGLDYVRAARGADALSVAYESRKPPAAWSDELARLGLPAQPAETVTLFEGNAREAAARYPANLNVAATLALAGPGFEATKVSVVVDPAAGGNTHRIAVTSALGTLDLAVANRPSPDNPKTSWIVGRSLLAAIEQHFSTVVLL